MASACLFRKQNCSSRGKKRAAAGLRGGGDMVDHGADPPEGADILVD
jgi:hypothetical protein